MNKNTVEFLKRENQGVLIDLEDKLSSVNVILKGVLTQLIDEAKGSKDDKDYEEVLNVIEAQKFIIDSVATNSVLIDLLKIEKQPTSPPVVEGKIRYIDDYDEYAVNTEEPHSLQEDFRFKRPHAFQIGKYYDEATTWKEMLIRTCEYLNKLDPEKFESFADDESMQWGETHNFSKNKDLIREPQLINGSKVYVEIAKGSIGARQMIIKMLGSYEIDIDDYKVYLRADYSPKRERDDNYRRRQR